MAPWWGLPSVSVQQNKFKSVATHHQECKQQCMFHGRKLPCARIPSARTGKAATVSIFTMSVQQRMLTVHAALSKLDTPALVGAAVGDLVGAAVGALVGAAVGACETWWRSQRQINYAPGAVESVHQPTPHDARRGKLDIIFMCGVMLMISMQPGARLQQQRESSQQCRDEPAVAGQQRASDSTCQQQQQQPSASPCSASTECRRCLRHC